MKIIRSGWRKTNQPEMDWSTDSGAFCKHGLRLWNVEGATRIRVCVTRDKPEWDAQRTKAKRVAKIFPSQKGQEHAQDLLLSENTKSHYLDEYVPWWSRRMPDLNMWWWPEIEIEE
ncbi:MAG: hypothetical protein V3U94_02890 [Candidatus Thorarchaeota archaeon]